ncbi:hypothetical protein E3P77_00920 [Wallemia ichthyophaga]|uniref:RING-type domain-containing protein n=2 Tax=Wallemia ichthyophaga TaxID=245174 RepID=A0A4T0LH64_WALIC|nr:uncharacterized protein J056_000610 [Wallemia ichthyophaga EXF-994]TIB34346.1 hypothetical protein E3P86_02830 [Wallemia ichthyophaga]EOR00800.1 hypothetical protein J056_000610 [Wallemia ichthyophaga EXF-994]TIB36401.1 hypothetical protein E3P84_01011 [Wallemia ichthyophaga]TIB42728.1 hypothetical protein E3P83_01056 [Wallemia ichthyophaga]TIB68736.1 hypothetical protein E3P77_00920 [Wallemia ichthyophaga]
MFKVRWNRKKSDQKTPSSPITPLHPLNDNLESPARQSLSDGGLQPVPLNHPSPNFVSPISPSANAILADQEDKYDNCPVCLEPLSFSFRLPGEKPHIVPLCGHALHDQCFTQVYGPLPSAKMPSKSLGVCGICRKPMKLSDDADVQSNKKTSKINKLDKLAGIASPPLGRDLQTSHSSNSLNNQYASYTSQASYASYQKNSAGSGGNFQSSPSDSPSDPLDSSADDAIPAATTNSSNTSISNNSKSSYNELVSPNISIRTEFNAAIRPHIDQKSAITAIVTVGIPSRHSDSDHVKNSNHPSLVRYQERHHALYDNETFAPLNRSESRTSGDNTSISSSSNFSTQAQPAQPTQPQQTNSKPLKSVASDLYARILDWKGNNPHSFGSLLLYSLCLTIRRSTQSQTAQVFLFENALICVSEDRKSAPLKDGNKSLKLKGKIYISNIRRVVSIGDTGLVLETEAEDFRDLTLMFIMRDEREQWKSQFDKLIFSSVNVHHQSQPEQQPDSPQMSLRDRVENDRSGRLLSPQTGPNRQSIQSPHQTSMTSPSSFGGVPISPMSLPHSPRSTQASSIATSGVSSNPSDVSTSAFGMSYAAPGDNKGRDSFRSSFQFTGNPPIFNEQNLAPLSPHDGTLYPHAPADIVLILPLPTSQHGSPTLKLRFLKSSLEFVINKLGHRDRICVVTFKSIQGGALRRTPFISPSSVSGKQKLSRFLETFGSNWEDSVYGIDGAVDPFKVGTKDDEKTDVVTAMNAALDGVLQRTAKNSVTGIFLVSDNQDPTRRAQMELVLARAEAASVPIHTLGWSRVHDPSSLWLLSSHTGGTYTFVKEWNQLRDCIAGAVGGLFSVAATNMKLHINVLDWPMIRVRKVSPSTSTIVSNEGNEVHVELGEIHYGEQRELLVEMDLIHPIKATIGSSGQNTKRLSRYSAQANVNSNIQDGLSGLSVGETMSDAYDDMIDEAALFEVDASYHDPNVGRSVSRLVQPVLLTMTIYPNIQPDAHTTIGSSPTLISQRLNAILGSPDAKVIRRRMELLSSDMITRALILISRKNNVQAQRLLTETVRLVRMAISNLVNSTSFSPTVNSPSMSITPNRFKKDHGILNTADILEAILFELESLLEGLEEHKENFDREQRNLGAQQAMILRDQKSWTGRSPIERLFWNFDNSRALLVKSLDWNK